jgi:predicted GH43/DUF377 family glycosyl hydrolase
MYPTSSSAYETRDVFDKNQFHIKGVYGLEVERERDFFFRWTKSSFYIKPLSREIKNVVLSLYNIFPYKKITIITSNFRKEFDLLYGEYNIFVPLAENDQVDVFVEPTYIENDQRMMLGICIKKLFIYELEYRFSKRLIDIEDITKKIEFINHHDSADIWERIKVPFEEQTSRLKFLPLQTQDSHEDYFNPCLFELNKKQYLMVRHSYVSNENVYNSEINLFKYPSLEKIQLNIKTESLGEQHEDAKVFVYQDKLIVPTSNYYEYKKNFFHEKLLILNHNFEHLYSIHPIYGKNGNNVRNNSGDEKNWTFFEHDGKMMFVYQMHPHTVVEMDLDGNIKTEYKTHFDVKSKWKFGEPRLSTNPIYKDGHYHSFFHSHILIRDGYFITKVYFMGYYKFKAEPPFEIVEVKEKPILWGNDVRPRKKPLVVPYCVFPCGAILKDNTFHISVGINDEECAILEYDLPS